MGDPVTIGLAVLSAGLSVAGGFQQAAALEAQADSERQVAAEEAERERRNTRRRVGQARANIGASGITVEGAPLEVLSDIVAEGELGAQTTIFEGDVRARALQAQGRSALTSGFIGAGSSLLSAGSAFESVFAPAAPAPHPGPFLSFPSGSLG